MARQPKPWFREGRGWHVQLGGKQVFLGEQPKHLPDPKRDEDGEWHPPQPIMDAFYTRMAGKKMPTPTMSAMPTVAMPAVASVIDAYMGWLKARVAEGSKAKKTLHWYEKYLTSFLRFLRTLETPMPAVPSMTVDQLIPIHVYQWTDAQAGWKTGKRGAMIAVQRAFNWAEKAGLLKAVGRSPLMNLEKPPQGRRERLVSEEEYREVMSCANDQEFRDLVELAYETGTRPAELFTVEAAFVELATGRWVFPIRLSKGKKIQRVVFLSDRALEITRRLMLKHPTGLLLRTTTGNPWCVSSVKCRFQQICRIIGLQRLKEAGTLPPKIKRLTLIERKDAKVRHAHEARVLERRRLIKTLARERGIRVNLYAFRHSRITESLVNGIDAVTVSVLAGHRDTTMISRFYAHVSQKHEHMREAANRAVKASGSSV